MAKVNVYLPDDLAEEVRAADLNVSAVCQAALRDVLDVKTDDRPVDYELLDIADRLRETARFGDKPQLYGWGHDQGAVWAQRAATAHDLQLLERGEGRGPLNDPFDDDAWDAIDMEQFDTLYGWYWDNIAPTNSDGASGVATRQMWLRTPFLDGFLDGALEIWKRAKPLLDPAAADRARRLLEASRAPAGGFSDEPPF